MTSHRTTLFGAQPTAIDNEMRDLIMSHAETLRLMIDQGVGAAALVDGRLIQHRRKSLRNVVPEAIRRAIDLLPNKPGGLLLVTAFTTDDEGHVSVVRVAPDNDDGIKIEVE